MNWLIRYDPMDLITDDLYLGNIAAASDAKLLEKYGITHILRVLKGNFGKLHYDKFTYKIIQIDDLPNQNIQKYFEAAHKFIDDALSANENGRIVNKVLVHCQVGMSRSATIVISYLMKKFPDMTLAKALRFTKAKRPIVNPNQGFIKQLKNYEKFLEKQRYTEKLAERADIFRPENSREKAPNPTKISEAGFTRDEYKSRTKESKNYHFSRGASAAGNSRSQVDLIADYQNAALVNYDQFKKKEFKGHQSKDKYYGNSFLEQNLKMHNPSILQKNGIDLTTRVGARLKDSSSIPDYSKIYLGHNLKKQQVFSSPVPVNKGSLLPTQNSPYPYIQVPSYVQYMSPQRNYSKIGQLLDTGDRPYKEYNPNFLSRQMQVPEYR